MKSDRGSRSIGKVLLSIDGSVTSMKAARYGISLAMRSRSDLIGLTVIDLMSLPYGSLLSQTGTRSQEDDVLEEKRMEAKKWLEVIERSMSDAWKETGNTKVMFRSEIIEDPFSKVEKAIVEFAEKENVDLIIMGSRGRSGFRRTLLGSVALAVLSYAQCPVLIVR
jgi:nucleotide-binding universal stress UspA family protein